MQKLLLILCVAFLPFSCSDVSTEEEDSPPGEFEDDSGDDEEGTRGGRGSTLGSKTTCEGDDYTLYLDDCPEEGSQAGPRSSTLSGQDFPEGQEIGQPIDILFVLDTSASMFWWYDRFHFEKKLKNFLSHLKGVNWRMLFTTASLRSAFSKTTGQGATGQAMPIEARHGLLKKRGSRSPQRYLDSSSEAKQFFYTITKEPNREHEGPGESGIDRDYANKFPPYMGGGEYPLRALQSSFAINKPLTREEATFVAIIVSNTDEHTDKKSPDPTAESIMQAFQKAYGESKKLYILNLIILPGDQKCLAENDSRQFIFKESNEGQKIAKVAEEIGGGNFSICMEDYSVVADTVARLSTL